MSLPKYENKPFKPPKRLNSVGTAQAPIVSRGKGAKGKDLERISQPQLKKLKITSSVSSFQPTSLVCKRYFTMLYRKPSMKKHLTWNGDGYATFGESNKFTFYNELGSPFGSSIYTGTFDVVYDNILKAGSLEIQLDYEINDPEELTDVKTILTRSHKGKSNEKILNKDESTHENPIPMSSGTLDKPVPQVLTSKTIAKFKSHTPVSTQKKQQKDARKTKAYLPVFDISKVENPLIMNKGLDAEVDVVVDPLLSKHLRPHQREGVKFMYDCVLGLARPSNETVAANEKMECSKSHKLKYDLDIQGCLLADEMGLGKTLMTITLIWTLLKQTPMASRVPCSQAGIPLQGLCSKILVVCPVTLIANWKREFAKWLNLSRIGILTLNANNKAERDKYDVRNFLRVQRTYQVLVIGYEKLLSVSEELENGKQSIDLLVCDEGHRLKNGSSKVLNVLKSLDINKKILLSGTPIQNDLDEFYTIIDFVNAGVLGSYSNFKKRFINPITRARDPANRYNENVVEKGEERSKEMIQITQRFILRRTNSILSAYLPRKMDIILFCKPTETQISAFRDILQGASLDFQNFKSSLALITLFKKICNSPTLIGNDSYYKSAMIGSQLSKKYDHALNSGKLKVLMALLERIKNGTDSEKVVIVSNYTQTLDIIENLMKSADIRICRMDGSTPSKQRDSIVTMFNHNPSIFAFLLSAKSGGVGLNLIGASRLILFDNDWNPSVDLQAMSRIHRDGQKKPCYIYRLVTTGCIDEKILQRQLMKHSLSQKFLSDNTVGKGNADDDLFNKEDLKDLFTVLTDTSSNTHDLICSCEGAGEDTSFNEEMENELDVEVNKNKPELSKWISALKVKEVMEDLNSDVNKIKTTCIKRCLIGYKHIHPDRRDNLLDSVATEALTRVHKDITFAFVNPGEFLSSQEVDS